MSKLDRQNRIYIPSILLKNSRVNTNYPISFFLAGDSSVFIDSFPYKYRYTPNLGIAYIDNKHRLYISSYVRHLLDIDIGSELNLFVSNDVIFIKKYTLFKKNYKGD